MYDLEQMMYLNYRKGLYGLALDLLEENAVAEKSALLNLITGLCLDARANHAAAFASLCQWHSSAMPIKVCFEDEPFHGAAELACRGTVVLSTKFIDSGDYAKAEELLHELVGSGVAEKYPECIAIAIKNLGISYYNRGVFHEALEHLQKAIPLVRCNGYDVSLLYETIARCYDGTGGTKESVNALLEGLSLHPEGEGRVALYLCATEVSLKTGDLQSARYYLRESKDYITLCKHSVSDDLLSNGAAISANMGDWESARVFALEGSVSTDVNIREDSLLILCRSYYENHEWDEASTTCDALLAGSRDSLRRREATKIKCLSLYASGNQEFMSNMDPEAMRSLVEGDDEFRSWLQSVSGPKWWKGVGRLFKQ